MRKPTTSLIICSKDFEQPLISGPSKPDKSGALDSMMTRALQRPKVLANGHAMIAPTFQGHGYDEVISGNYEAILSISHPIFTKSISAPHYKQVTLQIGFKKNHHVAIHNRLC